MLKLDYVSVYKKHSTKMWTRDSTIVSCLGLFQAIQLKNFSVLIDSVAYKFVSM